MPGVRTTRAIRLALLLPSFFLLGSLKAAELDPKAISIKLPKDIQWRSSGGSEQAVLVGDPSKPGMYVVLTKWPPGRNSRPHSHPNDRFITVLSGAWYVGTGSNYDPNNMTPVPAGSFVTHFANQMHYDGAKDTEVILEIVGMGPTQ